MTMAAAIESRTAEAPARSRVSHIVRVDIVTDLGHAEAVWRRLEDPAQFSTPYQRFDLLANWQMQVGARENSSPFIVVAYDGEGRPLLLLPLALEHKHGFRVASFMGGKHTTFNMALWDKDFAKEATAADLAALLSGIRERSAADVLSLTQQPKRWRDISNPFANPPMQSSVNDCPVLTMVPGAAPTDRIGHSFRRRLKSKERKLQSPGYRYHVAGAEPDIARLLDWFFRVKPLRMAEQRLPNVFAEPGVENFIRGACLTRLADGGRAIDLHALECDEEVIALFAGVADGDRFSMMFNTYTMSDRSRYSPGLILMRNIIDHYGDRGYRALDLGIGSDDYKRMFCKSDEPIFDSFIPLNSRGKLAVVAMSGANRAKRLVKRNQTLLRLAQRLRRAVS
jgi:CelD/BcsL family acetyltransferase involved in cellulose biosynthesis